jgi:uncharacterized protein (DUF1800 family)
MTNRVLPSINEAIAASAHVVQAPLRWNPAEHLLARVAFGGSPQDRAFVAQKGIEAWVSQQIAIGQQVPVYEAMPVIAAHCPLLSQSPAACHDWLTQRGRQHGWDVMHQLSQATLGLQVWSPAQLYETLVDFWSNHLNVPNHDNDVWITRHVYDRDVIRPNALGKFRDLLTASSKGVAMLIYLSLGKSNKTDINENYGRELLELHTVGLHYSETDVRNAAALLTGRTYDANYEYRYDPTIHPTWPVKILGFSHANATATGGEAAGDALLAYLASHPQTASHLAQKMCTRFVSDSPSAELVQAVAQAYLDNDTAVLPMVDTILRSTEFWESRGAKIRRPAENLVATARTLQPSVSDWTLYLSKLQWLTHVFGNTPLDWPAPDGYPDVAEMWRSSGTLLSVWNMHMALVGSWYKGATTPAPATFYAAARPATSEQAVRALARRLTGIRFSDTDISTLLEFVGEPGSTPIARSKLRWMAKPLMSVILDGPHFALR